MAKAVYGLIYRVSDLRLLQLFPGSPLEGWLFLHFLLELGKDRYIVKPKP